MTECKLTALSLQNISTEQTYLHEEQVVNYMAGNEIWAFPEQAIILP